jgi:metal-dependent hydrolase (beta-lactamase superfamily II)
LTGVRGGPGWRVESGVSYLIRAGGETLLFDTGLNPFRRSRSALVDNAETLAVDSASASTGCNPPGTGIHAPAELWDT